jgi:hypothetical protein
MSKDDAAILLQGFVRASHFAFQLRTTPRRAARCREWILPALTTQPIRSQHRSNNNFTHISLGQMRDSHSPLHTRLAWAACVASARLKVVL